MNQATIDKYNIKFINRILELPSGKQVSKTMDINNYTVGCFLTSFWKPEKINQNLLSDINDVLNGMAEMRESQSATIPVNIYRTKTVFYIDDVGTDYPQIPTTDFKEIVEGWRDFLMQPPLDMSKI